MSHFNSTPLFGGAMKADLPSTYQDVSDIRQVPDNQEVYLDANGFASITIDIMERVDANDEKALETHLADVMGAPGEVKTFEEWQPMTWDKMPSGTACYTTIVTGGSSPQQQGRPNEPDFVVVLLSIIRLEPQRTDLVVAVNVPFIPGRYVDADVNWDMRNLGPLGEEGLKMREVLKQTLEVVEWGLFV